VVGDVVMAHKNVSMALAAAQADMGAVKKGSVNPAFKSKYADLADVMQAVLPAINAQGLALYHTMRSEGERDYMVTIIAHGETETQIECAVPLIVDKSNMQGMKSAITYAKRIGTESLTGVAPDDDDGNAASKAPVKPDEQITFVNGEQITRLQTLLEATKITPVQFCKGMKVKTVSCLPVERFPEAVERLEAKLADMAKAETNSLADEIGDDIPY
jgi:hypothetical protein